MVPPRRLPAKRKAPSEDDADTRESSRVRLGSPTPPPPSSQFEPDPSTGSNTAIPSSPEDPSRASIPSPAAFSTEAASEPPSVDVAHTPPPTTPPAAASSSDLTYSPITVAPVSRAIAHHKQSPSYISATPAAMTEWTEMSGRTFLCRNDGWLMFRAIDTTQASLFLAVGDVSSSALDNMDNFKRHTISIDLPREESDLLSQYIQSAPRYNNPAFRSPLRLNTLTASKSYTSVAARRLLPNTDQPFPFSGIKDGRDAPLLGNAVLPLLADETIDLGDTVLLSFQLSAYSVNNTNRMGVTSILNGLALLKKGALPEAPPALF